LGGVLGASLAGLVLGGATTAGGVSQGFGILALVGVAVGVISLGLPGRRAAAAVLAPAVEGADRAAAQDPR
jgi:hypothetical protein